LKDSLKSMVKKEMPKGESKVVNNSRIVRVIQSFFLTVVIVPIICRIWCVVVMWSLVRLIPDVFFFFFIISVESIIPHNNIFAFRSLLLIIEERIIYFTVGIYINILLCFSIESPDSFILPLLRVHRTIVVNSTTVVCYWCCYLICLKLSIWVTLLLHWFAA